MKSFKFQDECPVCFMTRISSCRMPDCPDKSDTEQVGKTKNDGASCSLNPEGGKLEEENDTLIFNYV